MPSGAEVLRKVLNPLRTALLRMVLRTGHRVQIAGVEVVDISKDSESGLHVAKLREALDLMVMYAPEELARVQRDLGQVVVFTGSGAQYHPRLRACLIDAGYVTRQPPARLAMSLVHEAEHARMSQEGVGYVDPDRAKIERMCVEAEIQLANKIPGTQDLVESVRGQLTRPWWTEAELFARRTEQLRASGWPEWFVKCYERAFRPRTSVGGAPTDRPNAQ